MTLYWPDTSGDNSHINVFYGPNYGNVFTTAQTPTFLMHDATYNNAGPLPAPTSWTCHDIFGNSWSGTVTTSSGGVGADGNGNTIMKFSITPQPGKSSFPCGWYRLQTTGNYTASSNYGNEGGDTSFMVVNVDSRFPSPPSYTTYAYGGYNQNSDAANNVADEVMGALTGSGPFRWQIEDVTNSAVATDATHAGTHASDSTSNWYGHYASANRPRQQFLQFPNGAIDCMALWSDSVSQPSASGDTGYESSLNIVTITGTASWIQLVAGTQSGTVKLQVSQPQNTVVETYDNLTTWANVVSALNNNSSRLRAWSMNSGGTAQQIPQRPILVTSFNGTTTVVQNTYPNITIFEGPYNEPSNEGENPSYVALQSLGFKAAVKAGNSNAKVMGPCCVSFNSGTVGWLNTHLQNLPANFYDIISVHGYNTTLGDMALSDKMLTNFKSMLSSNGYGSTPIWMTEMGIFTSTYGIQHWRRSAHWVALWYLVYETYGIPREQQAYFYPTSHGFTDFPSWAEGGGYGTLLPGPMNMMWRGLTERTYNSLYQSRLTFSGAAASVFFGSIYKEPGTSQTVVLMNVGMPSGQITLGVSSGTTVSVYDWAGNMTTQTISGGQVTITTSDLPTYVMTTVGATITVVDANAGLDKAGQNLVQAQSQTYNETTNFKDPSNSGSFNQIGNNVLEVDYTESGDSVEAYRSQGPFPQEIKFTWPTAETVSRVLIQCMPPWQYHSTLTQFNVQTWSGSAWVTQYSYTSANATSTAWISPDSCWNSYRETYWDEQWIWDVKFTSPVSTTEVRVVIQAGSSGGEPDAASIANGYGQGDGAGVSIREIGIY